MILLDDEAEFTEEVLRRFRSCDSESLRIVSVNYDEQLRRIFTDHEVQNLFLVHSHHHGHDGFSPVVPLHGELAFQSLYDKIHRVLLTCPQAKELRQEIQSERAASVEDLRPDPGVAHAIVSEEEPCRNQVPPPPLEDLCHLLKSRFPVLYDQVLEPTFADLRYEHSAALGEGHPGKAHWILLRGFCALVVVAVRQLGFSLLDRIAAFWQTRSIK